jgi:hypothetical protein
MPKSQIGYRGSSKAGEPPGWWSSRASGLPGLNPARAVLGMAAVGLGRKTAVPLRRHHSAQSNTQTVTRVFRWPPLGYGSGHDARRVMALGPALGARPPRKADKAWAAYAALGPDSDSFDARRANVLVIATMG